MAFDFYVDYGIYFFYFMMIGFWEDSLYESLNEINWYLILTDVYEEQKSTWGISAINIVVKSGMFVNGSTAITVIFML